MRVRVQFVPSSFVNSCGSSARPVLKGQMVFTYMADDGVPCTRIGPGMHERCEAEVMGDGSLGFTPIKDGEYASKHLPRALEDDEVYAIATTMLRTYLAAKCGKDSYTWTGVENR